MLPWIEDNSLKDLLDIIHPQRDQPPSTESLNWVRERLVLWKLKAEHTTLNLEVDTTLSVVTALLKDRSCQERLIKGSDLSGDSYDLCAHYALVIVKFCNLLPYYKRDSQTNNITRCLRRIKRTIRDLGEELNLPTWVLDCRHSICHTSNNSLVLLRQANHFILSWIYSNFWCKQLLEVNQEDLEESIRSDIQSLLELTVSRERRVVFERLEGLKEKHRKVISRSIAQTLIEDCIKRYPNLKLSDFDAALPILIFYSKILRLISSWDDFEPFLSSLSEYLQNDNKKLRLSVEWFRIIIKSLDLQKENRKFRRSIKLGTIMKDQDTEILWLRILYIVAKAPNRYTHELIDQVITMAPSIITSEKIEMLKKTARHFLTTTHHSSEHSKKKEDQIRTVDDLRTFFGDGKHDAINNNSKIDVSNDDIQLMEIH
ncbi:uncharacterized protein LOC141858188 [Brevipalpus obovatus]|uniref:uncharacterized protein LOC141858188 n=1 Tax=Brevipalpus obovatus TaxID=246614 RepID=UPI003D9E679D